MNEAERRAGLPATPGYRYADAVGDWLFVSGAVPQSHDGQIVAPEDVAAQADQCLRNLSDVLRCHGFAREDLRQLRIYVTGDANALDEAWRAVRQWFHGTVPPATLLGVARLGYEDQRVEIDATVMRARVPGIFGQYQVRW